MAVSICFRKGRNSLVPMSRLALGDDFARGDDAFAEFLLRIAAAMRAHGCTNLKAETVKGAAHYVAEEKPEAVADLIEHYAAE